MAVSSAGRTDRGVTAVGQVASFKTETHPHGSHVMGAINAMAPGLLCAYDAVPVPRSFHATFGVRYLVMTPGPLHEENAIKQRVHPTCWNGWPILNTL